MRISRPIDLTFKSHLQNVYYVNDVIDEMEMMQLLSKFEQLGSAMNYTTPILFSIDYTKSQYVVMTNSTRMVIGQDPREFLEGGMPYLIDIFQKDDFKVYNENVFVENNKFLKNQPQADHHKFIFSYNFRVRHKTGKYVSILQRGCYVTSKETGLPLYSLGMVVDITHFKKDRLIYHTIEKTEEANGNISKSLIESNCFFPYEEDKMLSKHERGILGYMAEGYSSKQIAGKLKISENTIANHRKNMLKKTGTKNVAELIAFACRSGLV
jgi:DNA-binding CsgD family transcriptional regulator